jgi:hypothetical protein
MTTQEITERMRVLLDAALARHRGEITEADYSRILALGIDVPSHAAPGWSVNPPMDATFA